MKKQKNESEKEYLLALFQSKARCFYTQHKAEKALLKLKNWLSTEDYGHLCTAKNHFNVKLGSGEIDLVCEEIRKGWKK